jgi:competence protein ComEC
MAASDATHGNSGRRPISLAFPAGQGRGWLGAAAMAWLDARLDAERGRWFLWLPVIYGAGIAIYLGAPQEPPFLVCSPPS